MRVRVLDRDERVSCGEEISDARMSGHHIYSKADAGLVADKELGLAVKLIEALIAARIQGGEVAAGKAQPALAAPVVDIMEALKKSLAATRKPVARAEEVSSEAKAERQAPKRQAKRR